MAREVLITHFPGIHVWAYAAAWMKEQKKKVKQLWRSAARLATSHMSVR